MRKLILLAAATLIALPVAAVSAQDKMADHKMEAGKMADHKMEADKMADHKMAAHKMAPKHKAMHKKHHAKKMAK